MTAATSLIAARERIDALTGLRFVAAAVVAVEHFPEMIPGLDAADAAQGGAGVSLFFVLSGFVLVHTYGEQFASERAPDATRRFSVARFGRIVPLHLVALAIVTVLVFALRSPLDEHPAPALAVGLAANVLLVHAWFPFQVFNIWNGPAWSISVEAFFYASFPLLVAYVVWPLLRRRWLGRAILVLAALHVTVFLVVSIGVASLLLGRSGDVEGTRLVVSRLANVPVLRIGEFAIGAMLGAAHRPDHRSERLIGWRALESPRVRLVLLTLAGCASVAIQFTSPCPATSCYPVSAEAASLVDLRLFVSYLPVVVTVIAAVAWGPTMVSRLLATRPLVRLGEISFAFYILQWAAWLVINDGPAAPTQAEAFAAVGASLAASFIAYRWIEVPARRAIVARWANQGRDDMAAQRPRTV